MAREWGLVTLAVECLRGNSDARPWGGMSVDSSPEGKHAPMDGGNVAWGQGSLPRSQALAP